VGKQKKRDLCQDKIEEAGFVSLEGRKEEARSRGTHSEKQIPSNRERETEFSDLPPSPSPLLLLLPLFPLSSSFSLPWLCRKNGIEVKKQREVFVQDSIDLFLFYSLFLLRKKLEKKWIKVKKKKDQLLITCRFLSDSFIL
jgi:hypothetical protein